MTSINFEAVAPSSVDCKHTTNEDIASASLGPRAFYELPWPLQPSHQKAGLREPGKGGVAVVVEGDVPVVDASPGFGKGSRLQESSCHVGL